MLCTATSTYDDLKDADLVIEAVPENPELKTSIFRELGELLPEAILTSNTSSIPITSLSKGVKNSRRMAGMHFFNPPTKMPLVELISADVRRRIRLNRWKCLQQRPSLRNRSGSKTGQDFW